MHLSINYLYIIRCKTENELKNRITSLIKVIEKEKENNVYNYIIIIFSPLEGHSARTSLPATKPGFSKKSRQKKNKKTPKTTTKTKKSQMKSSKRSSSDNQ
jgi:hypothetical protein